MSGHFDPKTREFKDGDEWTELDHKIHDICYNWYIETKNNRIL